MPMPPSNSTTLRRLLLTSEEGVLEGVGIEDPEPVGGADCEAAVVLVEADVVDDFGGEAALGALDEGSVVDNG